MPTFILHSRTLGSSPLQLLHGSSKNIDEFKEIKSRIKTILQIAINSSK